MFKTCLRLQLIALTLIYLYLNFKFWTKKYDSLFYDTLLFGKIPLFWFIHLTIGGLIVLYLIYYFLQKYEAKKIIFLQIFVLIISLIALTFLEFTLRTFPNFLPLPLIESLGYTEKDKRIQNKLRHTVTDKYIDDPQLAILHKPNLSFQLQTKDFSYPFHTDSRGFTNFRDETLYNQADIVTLGDSFTEGVGVPSELSYPNQLARLSHQRVLNLGHGSYDSYQYPIVLKRYGLTAKPKIVIVTFWSYNDAQSRYFLWNKANTEEPITYRTYLENAAFIQDRKLNRHKLYTQQLFSFLSTHLLESYKGLWNFGSLRGITIKGKKISIPLAQYTPGSNEAVMENLTYLKSVLADLKKLSKENHFRLIIVYIPFKEEVYYRFIKNLPQDTKKGLDWFRNPAVKAIQEMNVDVIDLTPVFIQAAQDQKQVYHNTDVHLNQEGYLLTASTINTYIRK